jgi:ATP-binding cassette, subfamily C, bacterial CydC
MNKFIITQIFKPLAGRWLSGFLLLLFWTLAFIALPAISGWFLAACTVAFLAVNTMFAYLIPSSIIRMLTLLRTASRYFERLETHKTTLDAQRRLQLKIFHSVANLPYFKKQVNNNSSILENSTHGIDMILNHILLWILPLAALVISVIIYYVFLWVFSTQIALEFLISSAVLLFIVPQFIFIRNRKIYAQLKIQKEENNQSLIESFRGRIEISKYNLEGKAIAQHEQRMTQIEVSENKLQSNSFSLQLLAGLGFSFIAIFIFWRAYQAELNAALAIGIFFGIMAQAELAEMLFSGKSEKSSVAHQINDLGSVIEEGSQPYEMVQVDTHFESLTIENLSAHIMQTNIRTEEISLEIMKGDWIALYGETGKGKTTFLNSLFYPEYRLSGRLTWNGHTPLRNLPIPHCIYVTQKAYLLTGTLRENFEGYADADIVNALQTVDLTSWYTNLPNGLDTWLGENGETLSGGQRKKLLLAQALLKNPQLLVVDEPTAGISTDNAIAIFHNIRKQHPSITILMATHLMDFEKEVDRVIRM